MTRPKPIDTYSGERTPRAGRIFARSQGSLSARTVGGVTEIELIGEVGFDNLTETAVRARLADAGPVKIVLNSPGGDAFQGVGIFNALVAHPEHIKVEVTGVAASAASIIAMAGDEIAMGVGAHIMIHEAWSITIGNQADHLAQAEVLKKVDSALAGIYATRSGQPVSKIAAMMAAESWLDSDEAVALGLADSKVESDGPAARFDLAAVFKNVPAALRQPPTADTMRARDEAELKRLLIDAGLTRGAAAKVAAGGWPALMNGDNREISTLCARITAAADQMRALRETRGN